MRGGEKTVGSTKDHGDVAGERAGDRAGAALVGDQPERAWQGFGERVAGFDFLVMNEREIRAGAGILFVFGMVGFMVALTTNTFDLARAFSVYFLIDMLVRLVVSPKYSPSLALGRLAVHRQRPEWVSARPKRFAWALGYGLALATCLAFGLLNAPMWVVFTMCGLCLAMLFLETAFGICVGCILQQRFSKQKPELCPGDSCNYVAHRHRAG
jgi:hypothetical protein